MLFLPSASSESHSYSNFTKLTQLEKFYRSMVCTVALHTAHRFHHQGWGLSFLVGPCCIPPLPLSTAPKKSHDTVWFFTDHLTGFFSDSYPTKATRPCRISQHQNYAKETYHETNNVVRIHKFYSRRQLPFVAANCILDSPLFMFWVSVKHIVHQYILSAWCCL